MLDYPPADIEFLLIPGQVQQDMVALEAAPAAEQDLVPVAVAESENRNAVARDAAQQRRFCAGCGVTGFSRVAEDGTGYWRIVTWSNSGASKGPFSGSIGQCLSMSSNFISRYRVSSTNGKRQHRRHPGPVVGGTTRARHGAARRRDSSDVATPVFLEAGGSCAGTWYSFLL